MKLYCLILEVYFSTFPKEEQNQTKKKAQKDKENMMTNRSKKRS